MLVLKVLRISESSNLAHLNTNSLRNKLHLFADQIKGNVGVLAMSGTKLDDSFPTGEFKILSYAAHFRLYRNQNDGWILVFVREDIPVKFLSSEEKPIGAFVFELNFHLKKWLVCCSYNPKKYNIPRHLDTLKKNLDLYSAHYENDILIGDFNVSINDLRVESSCKSYMFKNLIIDPTCLENLKNPSCIDLILTNSPYSFQNSCVIETGLSDFHKIIVSVMKNAFQKLKPRLFNIETILNFLMISLGKIF